MPPMSVPQPPYQSAPPFSQPAPQPVPQPPSYGPQRPPFLYRSASYNDFHTQFVPPPQNQSTPDIYGTFYPFYFPPQTPNPGPQYAPAPGPDYFPSYTMPIPVYPTRPPPPPVPQPRAPTLTPSPPMFFVSPSNSPLRYATPVQSPPPSNYYAPPAPPLPYSSPVQSPPPEESYLPRGDYFSAGQRPWIPAPPPNRESRRPNSEAPRARFQRGGSSFQGRSNTNPPRERNGQYGPRNPSMEKQQPPLKGWIRMFNNLRF